MAFTPVIVFANEIHIFGKNMYKFSKYKIILKVFNKCRKWNNVVFAKTALEAFPTNSSIMCIL